MKENVSDERKEPAGEKRPTQGGAESHSQKAVQLDWKQVAFESSILGALLGMAFFLQSVTGLGATAGKVLGVIVFILGILTFPSWKGKKWILGIVLLGAVGGIVAGILSSVF